MVTALEPHWLMFDELIPDAADRLSVDYIRYEKDLTQGLALSIRIDGVAVCIVAL